MRYSLQSRFRGALVGAALGEVIGFQCQTRPLGQPLTVTGQRVEQWGLRSLESKPVWSCGRIIVDGVRQFVERQQWNLELCNGEMSPELFAEVVRQNEEGMLPSHALMGIVTALPIALFFHEDVQQLRYQLQQAIALWYPTQDSTELVTSSLIPLYAIALALQNQLEPHRLISEVIDDLDLPIAGSEAQLLHEVADRIAEGGDIMSLAQSLGRTDPPLTASTAMLSMGAIALWSVLNTPDDFRLTLLQVARLNHRPQLTCALAGALSGAYNGLSGIPLRWRSALQHQPPQHSALMALWTLPCERALLELADQLLAAWAGVLSPLLTPSLKPHSDWHQGAIAAANVIRPR